MLLSSSSAIILDCNFNSNTIYVIIGNVYQCEVKNSLHVKSREYSVIESATGEHSILKSNDDVISFYAKNKDIQFFPRGLEKVFRHLRSIYIDFSKIREVCQDDLKSLPNLVYLCITNSEIRFFEDGTFDFNPDLEIIWLNGNEIFHFDANVFKNLNKISWLSLASNTCMNMVATNSLVNSKLLIDIIQVRCYDSEFVEFKQDVKDLEVEGKILKLENFKNWSEKFEKLENFFRNSKFSNLNHFEEKFEEMKQKLPVLFIVFLNQLNLNLKNLNTQSCPKNDQNSLSLIEIFSKLNQKFEDLDKKLITISESIKEQAEDYEKITEMVSKKLHKIELEQKELKSKFHSFERKIDGKIAIVDANHKSH